MVQLTSKMRLVSLPKSETVRILGRCFGYLRPYGRLTGGAYLTLLGITALSLAIPQFIRWIIDQSIGGQDLRLLGESVLALLGLTVVRGILALLQGRWTETASQGVAYDLRNALHRQLAGLSVAYHNRAQTGQLLSRAIQDVERIRFLTGRASLRLVEGVVLLLGTAAVLLWMNPHLALLALATMPLLGYRAFHFGSRARPLSVLIQNQTAVLTTRLEQNLRGARTVKAFAQEEAEIAHFDRENERWFDLSAQSAHLQAINIPLLDLIANIGTVFIIGYGGLLVIGGQLSLGELVAFSTYLAQLFLPVRFEYTARYRAKFPGGMAHALSRMAINSSDTQPLLIFDGLRGLDEIRHAVEYFPRARFIVLDAPDTVRLNRLLQRGDLFDTTGVGLTSWVSQDSAVALLTMPQIETVFSKEQLQQIATATQARQIPIAEVEQKVSIIVKERHNYDSSAARDYLTKTLSPQKVIVVDTSLHPANGVVGKIVEWL